MNQKYIAVIGSDGSDTNLSKKSLEIAYDIGKLITEKQGILVCGGRSGIMEEACRGAKQAKGVTIGILPGENDQDANDFVDFPIPTGLGHSRNVFVIKSSSCVIALAGRWGTLSELSYAFIFGKPVILVKGTGGAVDFLLESKFLVNLGNNYFMVDTAEDAVNTAFNLLE